MSDSPLQNLKMALERSALGRAIRQDPKKAGILVVLLLILGIAGVRAAMVMAPAAAPANSLAVPGAGSGLTAPRGLGDSPRVAAAKSLQDWLSKPATQLSRNVFAIRLDYFPSDGTQTMRSPEDGGFWDELAKSVQAQADEKSARRRALNRIMNEAAQLRVQSTLMGPNPKALVNGQLVREGDVVASFRIDKIESRRIIVEQMGIKLEIKFDTSAQP